MPKIAKPRRRGNRWEINWIDGTGKRRFKSFAGHKRAKAALRQLQAEADAVRSGAAPRIVPDKTFEELEGLWVEVKHRKRTLKDDQGRIRVHLRPAFGGMRLVDIHPTRIARFERDVSRRVSTNTVRQILGLLRAMLNVAVEHGWLAVAPKVRLPPPEEKDYRWMKSEDEMRRFLQAAQDTRYPGLMEFYAAALYTGMRAGELCGLRWSDVDLERRLLTVQRSFDTPTKTGAIRRVPILDPLLPLLREWKVACPHDEIVFPNPAGNMHVSNAKPMKDTFHRCRERAGIERVTFHDLRHTFASHWMLKGGDLFKLQRILGHKSIAMTLRYAHLAPDAFQKDLGRFGDFVPREGGGQVVRFGERG